MDGCKFDVPKEYQGIVFQEIQKPLNENADRTFKVNGKFSNFTYWNYDREPSDNDVLKQALVWNEFANVVCIFDYFSFIVIYAKFKKCLDEKNSRIVDYVSSYYQI